MDVASNLVFLYIVVVGVVGCAAFWLRAALARRAPEPRGPWPRLLVLAPAHNEEAVIGQLVSSLRRAADRYPGHVYIVVIADGCTDATPQRALAAGAEVLELPGGRGKQVAVQRALALLWERPWDAVLLFDADNTVHPDFLLHAGRAFLAGADAVQGYIATANPAGSWVAAGYACMYWWTHAFWQRARAGLGLPTILLGGTGCGFTRSVLEAVPWAAETVTDDLEYSVRLVLAGRRIVYLEDAVTYDEKPERLVVSLRQRTRWMRGHLQVYARHGLRVLAKAWRPAGFDLLVHALIPVAGLWGQSVTLVRLVSSSWPEALSWLLYSMAIVAPFAPVRHWHRLWTLPLMGLTWIGPMVWGMLTWRSRGWTRTPHTGSRAGLEPEAQGAAWRAAAAAERG